MQTTRDTEELSDDETDHGNLAGTDDRHHSGSRSDDSLFFSSQTHHKSGFVGKVDDGKMKHLAHFHKANHLVTGLEFVGRNMPVPAWHNQLEQLIKKGVKLSPFTGVWEVLEDSVDVYNTVSWEPRTIDNIDTVVLAAGGQAEDSLYHELNERHSGVHAIGDCFQPRDIELAVIDGHRIGREV